MHLGKKAYVSKASTANSGRRRLLLTKYSTHSRRSKTITTMTRTRRSRRDREREREWETDKKKKKKKKKKKCNMM